MEVEMNRKVFISGALTGIENPDIIKANYERLGQLCEELGAVAYRPWRNTDPVAHPHVSAREVYEVDRYHVSTADLVIAYVGIPSLGTGQEIEIAREHDVPVLLLYERGKPLSRITRGSPNIIGEIRFDDFGEALHQLEAILAGELKVASSPPAVPRRGR
jgi:nucleoside 2-deoxyribosyltransferase